MLQATENKGQADRLGQGDSGEQDSPKGPVAGKRASGHPVSLCSRCLWTLWGLGYRLSCCLFPLLYLFALKF